MKAAVKETSSHTSTQLLSGMVLQLLQKQPFIVWGASLVLVLLTGSIALKGLMSPGPVEPDSPPTPIAQTKKAEDAKQPQKSAEAEVEQASNLWLFGAIGLGCAAGSFLIAKRLEQIESQQTVRQKPQVEAAQPPAAMTRRAKPSQAPSRSVRRRKPAHRSGSARRVAVPAVAVAATPTPVPVSAYSTTTVMAEPVVTVVPDHETHPLDWGDASLADMMDLRKQRPLSHWL
jgi:hypothetical protein